MAADFMHMENPIPLLLFCIFSYKFGEVYLWVRFITSELLEKQKLNSSENRAIVGDFTDLRTGMLSLTYSFFLRH